MKLNKQCVLPAKKANNSVLGLRKSIASWSGDVILLFYSALLRHIWAPLYKRVMNTLGDIMKAHEDGWDWDWSALGRIRGILSMCINSCGGN